MNIEENNSRVQRYRTFMKHVPMTSTNNDSTGVNLQSAKLCTSS